MLIKNQTNDILKNIFWVFDKDVPIKATMVY